MLFTKQVLSVNETKLFSDLFKDYISGSENVKPFYQFHITEKDFENYFQKNNFDTINRSVLVEALHQQANEVSNTTTLSKNNIDLLKQTNTYTVTTGHQLCLFTGPLYFIYKIISTINLSKALHQKFPDKQFVPVYWMASEDHDFEEINHVHTFGKKVHWNSDQKGSVGDFKTSGLQEAINELQQILGDNDNSKAFIRLVEQAYLQNQTLSDATRYLVNELFGEYGIVILDGDDKALKSLFKEEFKKDVFDNASYTAVNKTINELKQKYSAQVNPREINVFYKENDLRERIEKDGDRYKVVNTDISFSKTELENLIDASPEKMSPNVVLRPLYQQKLLPNVAYIGGPGEIAYWLEYQHLFETYGIAFPILVPRHFVMLVDKGIQTKWQKLNLSVQDLFKEGEELVKQLIKAQHSDINLEDAKAQLANVYTAVLETITQIDKSLIGSAEAEKQKAINGLQTIEQKINRALKQKSETDVNQIWNVKGKLFPNNIPQERYDNFSMYYSKYGNSFIKELMEELTYDLKKIEYTILLEN